MEHPVTPRPGYGIPPFGKHQNERCRDCQELRKRPGFGNRVVCAIDDRAIRHSHRCDRFHHKGTLL